MDMATDFGKRLKEARKHAGLRQTQLAKLAGMSQSNVSELENTAFGSVATMQLALCCGVNPNWLATGEGSMLDALLVSEPTPGYAPSLGSLVVELGRMLRALDDVSRKPIGQLLNDVALQPDRAEQIAAMIEALLSASGKLRRA
jgi:transcriptional regulator with XRE-family HTH domain